MKIVRDIKFLKFLFDREELDIEQEEDSNFTELVEVISRLVNRNLISREEINDFVDSKLSDEVTEDDVEDYILNKFQNEDLNELSPIGYWFLHKQWHPDADKYIKDEIDYCCFPSYLSKGTK